MASLTKVERLEIRDRTAMTVEAASKLTSRWSLRKRIARLLFHLDSRALTTRELAAIAGWKRIRKRFWKRRLNAQRRAI